eukprot:579852-Rhodomonas_salina.3
MRFLVFEFAVYAESGTDVHHAATRLERITQLQATLPPLSHLLSRLQVAAYARVLRRPDVWYSVSRTDIAFAAASTSTSLSQPCSRSCAPPTRILVAPFVRTYAYPDSSFCTERRVSCKLLLYSPTRILMATFVLTHAYGGTSLTSLGAMVPLGTASSVTSSGTDWGA